MEASKKSRKTFTEEIKGTVSEIISQVKKLIKKGNARRILIKNKDGKILFQSQLTVGIGGAALLTSIAPIVSAISMFVLFSNDVKVIVERYPNAETEEDEYEVEADFVEIRDEEEENEEKKKDRNDSEDQNDKTVGKDDSDQ
ncbi:DUF4342 domain-containing protein [Fodinibius halophilus]|uniref:DUF4342 domain-containing protein n=1 Tax=Fodinibius halophilus TaxID=1736908 RepID=A0A6M1T627_9BACT|nr:DUF4342 domain-containing protein [Fodinibius halophilus]NGP89567.1 DUF4342 domain-containing protein [Fodinibius halophilus]